MDEKLGRALAARQSRVPKRSGAARVAIVGRMEAHSLADRFAQIHEHWRPKVAAELNGQELKLVKFQGEFPWHTHEREDELFLVWRGRMAVEFRDRRVDLGPGEFCVVPRGVEHRTLAAEEAHVLVFEPAATRNTGDVVDARYTAPNGVRI
jgi:mannose-6-phosphate isomerase-like protein (cupin superfamily)